MNRHIKYDTICKDRGGVMTDNRMLDIFDEEYNHLGADTYENVHLKGLWHQNFHCWLINPDTKRVSIILLPAGHMLIPEKFDIAIFGQMLAGEEIIAGKKEIENIFGISINAEELIKIGITKEISFIESKKVFHRVFSHSYFFKQTKPLKEYISNMKNIEGIFEISIDDALALFSDKVEKISATGVLMNGSDVHTEVSYSDFAQRGKSYLHKTLFMIDSWLEVDEWERKYEGQLD